MGPLPNGRTPWLVNGGDPNHLPIGVILQVPSLKLTAMLHLKIDFVGRLSRFLLGLKGLISGANCEFQGVDIYNIN